MTKKTLTIFKSLNMNTLLLLLAFPAIAHAFTWTDLWERRDQQAAKAFETGKVQEAAKLFDSSQWKGSALYRSGQYQQALKSFKQATTANGFYNQGNTLAQMGDFQTAIEAYEQALKIDPKMSDAIANRDLLKKIMENMPPDKQAKNDSEDKSQDQSQDKPQDKSQDQSQDKPQDKSQDQSQDKPQDKSQDQSQDKPQDKSQDQSQDKPQDKSQDQSQDKPQDKSQDQSQDKPQDKSQDQPQNQSQDNSPSSNNSGTNKQQELEKPIQAKNGDPFSGQPEEQLLRRIPDDPGGLLKQKFLRDHQRYQTGDLT